jgi:hypothetical protein
VAIGILKMIPRKNLPGDAAEWTSVSVSFPRLEQDSADSCPMTEDQVFDYTRLESADRNKSERVQLRFVRTARVADVSCWLWEYTEEDGQLCYVSFRQNVDGSSVLCIRDSNNLSHEQYLLADYYDEVYWD